MSARSGGRRSTQSLRIVVTGLIAQHPSLGGVTWDYLQYPLGLHRLGHDVYYLEDSGEWPYTLDGGPTGRDWIAYDCSANLRHLQDVMSRFGLGDRWAYRFPIKPRWFGLASAHRREILRTADLLINVSGTLRRPADYRGVRRLAYIDSDPGFTQVKLASPRGFLKFQRRVQGHDVHFTFGEHPSPRTPSTPYVWRPTRQPIVRSEWDSAAQPRNRFTTVMSWASYRPLRFGGERFGQKDVEFRRFLDLPSRTTGVEFEVAMNPTEHVVWETRERGAGLRLSAADRLRASGWHIVDARHVCSGLDRYREFIHTSKAEWSVAKHGYVAGHTGWFSCRSACYLAAGRPVVVQDTGFSDVIPTGRGLLAFSSPDDACDAVSDVTARYEEHARAAREIAAAHFDSDDVLTRLIDEAMTATAPMPLALVSA